MSQSQTNFPWIRAAAIGAGVVTAPLAAGIVYSAVAIDHAVSLPSAVEAQRRWLRSAQAGEVSYYVDEAVPGRPLVLVHSINAAASAYEMRPLFEYYRMWRPVFAPDLPGFGFSERADRAYSPALYTAAVLDLLRVVVERWGAADVIALSLGGEFAARAALQQPELVRSLTLISPTGFSSQARLNRTQRASTSQMSDRLNSLFSFPLWSQAFYDLLVSRRSIRYFLKMSFVGEPDPALVAYDYATSHQPGARFAPLAFVSGQLFTPDVRESIYEQLTMPVMVLYDRDPFVRFDALPDLLNRHANWHAERIVPSMGLPQFERQSETTAAVDAFWQKIGAGQVSGTP